MTSTKDVGHCPSATCVSGGASTCASCSCTRAPTPSSARTPHRLQLPERRCAHLRCVSVAYRSCCDQTVCCRAPVKFAAGVCIVPAACEQLALASCERLVQLKQSCTARQHSSTTCNGGSNTVPAAAAAAAAATVAFPGTGADSLLCAEYLCFNNQYSDAQITTA